VALLSCPFCRALFGTGEATSCPDCGLALVPLERLPLSYEAEAEEPSPARLPENELLPWTFAGRGRALLLVLAVLGLAAFFLPWVELTFPDRELRSGFDLARGRAGWLWGGAVGWLVVIPLVVTRRTIAAMRGVRPVTALLCALTLGEVLMLLAVPPSPPRALPMSFEWSHGLYFSAVLSAAAALVALFFGGSLPHLEQSPTGAAESSTDRTLH
jgi:hypothetical protein